MENRNAFYAAECRKRVTEYRAKASQYRGYEILRSCYVELAWSNRSEAREYSRKAA